jgi:hypothetical protein
MRDPTEHPTFIGKDEPLSLTEKAVFGADAVRCKVTGRVYEQGSGALPHEEQTRLFVRQAEIAKRKAAIVEQEAAQLATAPQAVPARRRGAEPI